jgi:glucokinase
MLVLAGDIGGTHSRILVADFADGSMRILKAKHYINGDYVSLVDVIDAFLTEYDFTKTQINSACFGVPGPVANGMVKFTNLPWVINASDIKEKLKTEKVELINDFSAIGYGLETLTTSDLHVIQTAKPRQDAIKAFIGAGTGIGVGFMSCHNDYYIAHPTEGGHVDFAPTDDTQIELLKYLLKKYHRVSLERVLSGQGLINIYHFVRDNRIFGEEEDLNLRFLIENEKKGTDIAAAVSKYAIQNKDIMAMRALDIFIRIYGAAVGNLALSTLPYGGLYVVGGIAPKLIPQIEKGPFLETFRDKGRVANLLKDVPLYIVKNTDVGLHGAAVFARRLATA